MEPGPSGTWRLLRDPLGLNKLFWAKDPEGDVLVAARLYLLIEAGRRFEEIQAVPSGSVADLIPGRALPEERSLVPGSWFTPPDSFAVDAEALGKKIRAKLDRYLSTLAALYPKGETFVCLALEDWTAPG